VLKERRIAVISFLLSRISCCFDVIFLFLELSLVAAFLFWVRDEGAYAYCGLGICLYGIVLAAAWPIVNQGKLRYERRVAYISRPNVRLLTIVFLVVWTILFGSKFNLGLVSGKTFEPEPMAYFDAHNHGFSGILPYYAYADLYAFIKNPEDPTGVDLEHRRELWKYLASSQPSGKASSPRIKPGASATVAAYGKNISELTAEQVNGALERVLTTTPWTEFDSAYAFRSAPVESYLKAYFADDLVRKSRTLCDATILELAVTRTSYSEQFLSFVGGWGFATVTGHPVSSTLDVIRCFTGGPRVLAAAGGLRGRVVPEIKVLFMTHTSELGEIDVADKTRRWMEYGSTGECAQNSPSAPVLPTLPKTIELALLGQEDGGKPIVGREEKPAYLDHVVGVDTAAPEITCFTGSDPKDIPGEGMKNYEDLVGAVYRAAKERRNQGWHGKLLVHTHVGEGGPSYQWDEIPPGEKARDLFSVFPGIQKNKLTRQPVHFEQANKNIKTLLRAVESIKQKDPGIDDYVVFRFGHVTHADLDDAREMKRLNVEADINLESNISTRAYYTEALATAGPQLLKEQEQFEYNNLPGKVLSTGHAVEVLSGHSLKFMLQAGVRTLLGSDGSGEEHSDIGREYKLASELIDYWKSQGTTFPPDVSADIFRKNADEHITDMREDKKRP
jgi:hypothetical protein